MTPDAKKSYREISHQSKSKNFFAHKELWEKFRDEHQASVDPFSVAAGSLEKYMAENPGFEGRRPAWRWRGVAAGWNREHAMPAVRRRRPRPARPP
ncbi:MAG: hypothetical protein K2X72_09255 [Reyranella sp.]|nr:hypothetical protein [Reyranella sp.]